MSLVVEVLGRVLIFGFIAAAYVSAREAFPEMYSLVSGPEALLATLGGGDHALSYLIGVCTAFARTSEPASYFSRLGHALGPQRVAYRPGA